MTTDDKVSWREVPGGLSVMDLRGEQPKMRVWWVPQVPMAAFYVAVKTIDEARLILRTLGNYDLFQLENNIKPDYANTGGLEVFENGEWSEWSDGDLISDIETEGA